ncbi:MAG: tyrosine-type recombinase/integrase [Acidobacteria bacterium]|nr:tyrosine-type recombinase/integrase [Acidobacteriota bacterium]
MAGKQRDRHYRIRHGKIYARITFTDASGKRRDLMRLAESKTHARELAVQMMRELKDHGEQIVDADRMPFRQLAELYKEARLQPAQYQGDRKIVGRRSYQSPQAYLRTLVEYLGSKRIRNITHADIEKFKLERLKTPTKKDQERSIASVNRELEVLRAVLRFAAQSGWLIKSPFETGESLISKADEVQRERILTRDEEARLLAVCVDRRAHLRPLLITALDTGMRRGELFKLKWSDVDLDKKLIRVRATTTKTMRGRIIGMTERAVIELQRLWAKSSLDPDSLVFGITNTVKTAFGAACRDAKIDNFRFHDCRHTAITRMIQAGMPPMQVMKISGHTQMTTFARYVNIDNDTARNVAAALDTFQSINRPEALSAVVN